jgi:hypothetical protein
MDLVDNYKSFFLLHLIYFAIFRIISWLVSVIRVHSNSSIHSLFPISNLLIDFPSTNRQIISLTNKIPFLDDATR